MLVIVVIEKLLLLLFYMNIKNNELIWKLKIHKNLLNLGVLHIFADTIKRDVKLNDNSIDKC